MINERFLVMLNGKRFVTYEGLLYAAHEKGIVGIAADIIQYPAQENNMTAIASATVTGKNEEVFSDVGDASPASCSSKLVPHLIRMASTRAKARALRDFTNIGMCSIEELGDAEPVLRASPAQYAK